MSYSVIVYSILMASFYKRFLTFKKSLVWRLLRRIKMHRHRDIYLENGKRHNEYLHIDLPTRESMIRKHPWWAYIKIKRRGRFSLLLITFLIFLSLGFIQSFLQTARSDIEASFLKEGINFTADEIESIFSS